MSVRAVSKLCGVTPRSVSTFFDKNPAKLLNGLGKSVSTFRGPNRAKIIHDHSCMKVVMHYAFNAGARCTETARVALFKFGQAGMRAWMNGLTGWKKPELKVELPVQPKKISPVITGTVLDLTPIINKLPTSNIAGSKQAWHTQMRVEKVEKKLEAMDKRFDKKLNLILKRL